MDRQQIAEAISILVAAGYKVSKSPDGKYLVHSQGWRRDLCLSCYGVWALADQAIRGYEGVAV